jgi:hypothetical protein
MFAAVAALFSSIVELVIFVGVAYAVYQIFLSDWVKAHRAQVEERKGKFGSLEKIALVKLVSEDPKDIEQFITTNAAYLSNDTVQKLVARIEALHTDKVISADDILKSRFEDLAAHQEAEAEAEAEHAAKGARG